VTIHTVQSLSKIQRRLDRQRRQAKATTAAMRKGAVLYHTMGEGWRLSTGVKVSDEVARIVTFALERGGMSGRPKNRSFASSAATFPVSKAPALLVSSPSA
jgi:hypothetical protein